MLHICRGHVVEGAAVGARIARDGAGEPWGTHRVCIGVHMARFRSGSFILGLVSDWARF